MDEARTNAHKSFAVECFNGTWDLIDKDERTPDEEDQMVHLAHASRYHWGEVGTDVHFERGDWQISKVYRALGKGKPALRYGQRCLARCEEHEIADFDIAFAHEAVSWGHHLLGSSADATAHFEKAKAAGLEIKGDEDREYFQSELSTLEKALG